MSRPDHKFVPYASKREVVACVSLGILTTVLGVLLTPLVGEPIFLTAGLIALYLVAVLLIAARRASRIQVAPSCEVYDLLEESSSAFLKRSKYPILLLNRASSVLWYNAAAEKLLGTEGVIGRDATEFLQIPEGEDVFTSQSVKVGEGVFSCEGFTLSEDGDGLYLLMLSDVTELSKSEKKYNDERVAIAYVTIDNVREMLQYVHDKHMDVVSAVDDRLKAWAVEMNAVIKLYDEDKYVMLLDSKAVDACIKDRFSILDTVRDTRLGDGASITISMGVSNFVGTLAEKEASAREAIDLALQRGGDQAVLKTEDSLEYYGGRTKAVYKRSNIRSRAFVSQLTGLIGRADNVIIMGHRFGDFDSFGASVGLAKFATLCGVKANIAVDLRDKNLMPCIEILENLPTYSKTFVDNADGLDLVTPDTLLIVCDVNSLERAQFADIAKKIRSVVVVDHHRKNDKFPENVVSSYIEPSASSTCELVAEMLENATATQVLCKEEADMLFAGILLDTKQFSRNTGTRTFSAAEYLRSAGASPTDVYDLFKTEVEDLSKEARFHTSIILYRGNIAISSCDGDTDESYRVIASKAADKMLTLRGVDASFTIVRIGDQIHISGRSAGKINVQLILEKLHGGGHFDVAGAQLDGQTVVNVLAMLKNAIDEYLDV